MESKLSLIKRRIHALRKKQSHILRIQESLSQGKTLDKEQQELLHSKPSVVARIDLLHNLATQISSLYHASWHAAITPGAHILTFGSFDRELPLCQLLQNQGKSSTNDKERYLCVSDGFSIYCLDLKQSEDNSDCTCYDPPPLPKLSTLNLPEKGLPILAGLFKLGSNAYIIGGREFPALEDEPHDWFMNIFDSYSNNNGLKGTSRVAYRLSLADGTLSLSECDHVKPLTKPICWPIVEKIGGELHVIESFPTDLFDYHDAKMAYHVALDVNSLSGGWDEIPHMMFECMSQRYGAHIWAHLVVGDRIYTKAQCPHEETLVFDSKDREWEEKDGWHWRNNTCKGPLVIDHVAEIFKFGRGRCVGGFLHGEFRNSLYVVFAIVVNWGSVHAVAYLVTCDGHVLCSQRVPGFFGRFVRPASVIESVVIDVEEEEEKTMCAVVYGKASNNPKSECLFICTFTVEEVCDARSWVGDVWRRASEKTGSRDERWSCEKEFVRVVVKKRYVYKIDDGITRLQACFL